MDHIVKELESPFKVWFMDDATIAGTLDNCVADAERVETMAKRIGLSLNSAKYEVYSAMVV